MGNANATQLQQQANKLGGSARKHRSHRSHGGGHGGGVQRSASHCPLAASNSAPAAVRPQPAIIAATTTEATTASSFSTEDMAKALGTELKPPDFDAGQRDRVISSWKVVGEHISEIGLTAYLEMFKRNPETMVLFPMLKHLSKEDLEFYAQLKNHAVRLTGVLTMLIAQLEQPSNDPDRAMANFLSELGTRHFAYGARPDQMELLGHAFVDTLMPIFEADPAHREINAAWNAFFALIVFWMQAGFRFVQFKGQNRVY